MCGFYWWNASELEKKEDRIWDLLYQIGAKYDVKEVDGHPREILKYGIVEASVTHYDDHHVVTIKVGKRMVRWKERYPGYIYDIKGDMETVFDKAIAYLRKMKSRKKSSTKKKTKRRTTKRKKRR